MSLSVIVPAYNEEKLLAESLAAIRKAAGPFGEDWELVVCDNNSTDRTAEIARAAGAKVVFEPHNQISRARNRGASVASGEWLLFIDADSTPSRELFADLKEAIDSGQVIGGGSLIAADSTAASARMALRTWNLISRSLHWAAGAFVYCETAAFRQAGGFSEELYASEELDLSQRLKRVAKGQGKEFRILTRHPLHTSDRKLHLYGWKELAIVFFKFLLQPRQMLRSAKGLQPVVRRAAVEYWFPRRLSCT